MTDIPSKIDFETVRDGSRRPMIVVDNAHVEYRVHASGKRVGSGESLMNLRSLRGGRELRTVPALRGVTFTASEGESIGVVGHNGSGKSTLFRAMSGLIPTSEGTILARDRPVLLGVNAALVPELSGEDNIKLGLLAMGYTAEQAAASVDEIADFAELNEFIHHPMRTYSSGMGARLRFAIASAKAHSILLIDEALSVGDRRFRTKSDERIRGLRDSAGLVMIVSHSVGSLRDTCERVLWVHKGELRADGPARTVINDYIKWTKQPGRGAVGAASARKRNRAPSATSDTTKTAAARSTAGETAIPNEQPEIAATGVVKLESLLADARQDYEKNLTGSVATQPLAGSTLARRDRYRRTARQRRRARIMAVAITVAVVLVAVGAGAAIALLTRAPAPVDRPAVITTPSAEPHRGPPAITYFDSSTPTVVCASAQGEAAVTFSWQVEDAVEVAIGRGPLEVDAIDAPMETSLSTTAVDHPATYSCADASQAYTLTAESADGNRISSVVTVTRGPFPESTPETVVPTDPVAPEQPVEPIAPVEPAQPVDPAQPVEPAQSVEPVESAPPTEPVQPPAEPSTQPTMSPIDPGPSNEPTSEPAEPQPSGVPSEDPSTIPETAPEPDQSAEPDVPAE